MHHIFSNQPSAEPRLVFYGSPSMWAGSREASWREEERLEKEARAQEALNKQLKTQGPEHFPQMKPSTSDATPKPLHQPVAPPPAPKASQKTERRAKAASVETEAGVVRDTVEKLITRKKELQEELKSVNRTIAKCKKALRECLKTLDGSKEK